MRKLILILLVCFAVFTYFRALESAPSDPQAVMSAGVSVEIPVEIKR
jgi:hypothetical protein